MKTILSLCFLFLSIPFLKSQISSCKQIYVWGFSYENPQKECGCSYAKDLTEAVEEAIVQLNVDSSRCIVLERRYFASLEAHVKNEKIIKSIKDIPSETRDTFSIKGAKRVVLGELIQHSRREFELRLKIENLESTQIERRASKTFSIYNLIDINRDSIFDLVYLLINERPPPPPPKKNEFFPLNDYLKKQKLITAGVGFAFRKKDDLLISKFPDEIKIGRPHPDDLKGKPNDILDPKNPQNYLIWQDSSYINAIRNINFEITASIKNFIHVSLKFGPNQEFFERILDKNMYRKNYIIEGRGGEALVYYFIKAKKQNLSLPISCTYPIFHLKNNRQNEHLLAFLLTFGTNLIWRPQITVEAEKGWDRNNGLKIDKTIYIGKLKQTEWFFGGTFTYQNPKKTLNLGLQCAIVNTTYVKNDDFKKNFEGIFIKNKSPLTPSFAIRTAYSF